MTSTMDPEAPKSRATGAPIEKHRVLGDGREEHADDLVRVHARITSNDPCRASLSVAKTPSTMT